MSVGNLIAATVTLAILVGTAGLVTMGLLSQLPGMLAGLTIDCTSIAIANKTTVSCTLLQGVR